MRSRNDVVSVLRVVVNARISRRRRRIHARASPERKSGRQSGTKAREATGGGYNQRLIYGGGRNSRTRIGAMKACLPSRLRAARKERGRVHGGRNRQDCPRTKDQRCKDPSRLCRLKWLMGARAMVTSDLCAIVRVLPLVHTRLAFVACQLCPPLFYADIVR